MIQVTHIQLLTNSHLWVINWKHHSEFFPKATTLHLYYMADRGKSYNSCPAITHFLTPGTHTLPKITVRITHPRWYWPTSLAYGLLDRIPNLYVLIHNMHISRKGQDYVEGICQYVVLIISKGYLRGNSKLYAQYAKLTEQRWFMSFFSV